MPYPNKRKSSPKIYCCSLLTKKEIPVNSINAHEKAYYKNLKQCKNDKCNKQFSNKENKYCSKSCLKTAQSIFNKRNHSAENRKNISETLINKYKTDFQFAEKHNQAMICYKESKRTPRTNLYGYISCNCCNKGFWRTKPDKLCCSPECGRKNSTYRKIIHKYKHKNGEIILLESSWEVKVAEKLDILNIDWTRPKHIPWTDTSGKKRKYFPDFYLPKYNLYLDPKNKYQISISLEKLVIISNLISLKYGDIKEIFIFLDKLVALPRSFA